MIILVFGVEEELSEIVVVVMDMMQICKGIFEVIFNDFLELIEDQVIVFCLENYDIFYCNKVVEEMFVGWCVNIDIWCECKVFYFIIDDDMCGFKMCCQVLYEGFQCCMIWEVMVNNGILFEISFEYVEFENDELWFIVMYCDIMVCKVVEKVKNDFVVIVSYELCIFLIFMKGVFGLVLLGVIGEMLEQMNKMVLMVFNNCDKFVMLINDMFDIEKMIEGFMEFVFE